jgi:hypothetical protein
MDFNHSFKDRYILCVFLIFTLLAIASCGNRKSPTGGPVDNEKPEIIFTEPLELEQIENNEVTIAFSKRMDKNSVESGLYINPPITNLKYIWDKNEVTVRIYEDLKDNTNYQFYLSKSIKCSRNNNLNENTSFTFRNGELQANKLSGYISFDDEDLRTLDFSEIKNINISLRDNDSLLVNEKEIQFSKSLIATNNENLFNTVNSYVFDYLNPGIYYLTAYADINADNKYDFGKDSFFYSELTIPTLQLLNIHLAVQDTVKPDLKSIKAENINKIVLEFNKELAISSNVDIRPSVFIFNDTLNTRVDVIYREHKDNKLHLITSKLDSMIYRTQISGLIDRRGNQKSTIIAYLESQGNPKNDTVRVIDVYPKDGSVVEDLNPEIRINFSDIVFYNSYDSADNEINLVFDFIETETKSKIPFDVIKDKGFEIVLKAKKALTAFNSYTFIIKNESQDINGNQLRLEESNFEIFNNMDDYIYKSQFIVIDSIE